MPIPSFRGTSSCADRSQWLTGFQFRGKAIHQLTGYRGGLVAVSHDIDVLTRLCIDTWLALDVDGSTLSDPRHGAG